MVRRIFLPLLALVGVSFAVFMIVRGSRKPPVTKILFVPPTSPYKHFVAGQGTIEAINKKIDIGVPFPELVTNIFVDVGTVVKKGDPLFKMDTRRLEAQLAQALQEQKLAETEYENACIQFNFYEKLQDKSATSEQDYTTALYNREIAQKKVEVAQAAVNVVRTDIQRSLIIAPIDGEVLQINVSLGEVANVNPFDALPLMIFGDTSYYHLRTSIDEEDAWRVIKGAPATAFVRGNSRIFIPLEYAYYEPLIIPKRELSGSDIERVDTRVFQVVYRFSKNDYPVYAGQLLDVFLEAKPNEAVQ